MHEVRRSSSAVAAVSDRRSELISAFGERRHKIHVNHKSHPASKFPPIRDTESVHHFPIADPTRRAATIFRPTNFRKANTGRVARLFFRTFRHYERAPVYLHPARQTQRLPAESGAALL